MIGALSLAGVLAMGAVPAARAAEMHKATALAEYGEPLYGPDMKHFPYANPDAPKGGDITLRGIGTFDTLNYWILQGDYPRDITLTQGALMANSEDELSSAYPQIAESVDYADDLSEAVFHLNPAAVYSDGHPITAGDFVFMLETIKKVGHPFLRSVYQDVASAEAIDDHTLKVILGAHTRKALLAAASLSPLPRYWWDGSEGRDPAHSTLTPYPSSGPYKIKSVDPGRSITYERVKDWWAASLPTQLGQNNFDTIKDIFFQDLDVSFEAFKGGAYDYIEVFSARDWATGFDVPAVKDGRIQKVEFPNNVPGGMQGFYLNTRRPPLDDIRVRQAISMLFDFEWINKNLLYGLYTRTDSFFRNSDFAASGVPEGDEKALLEKFKNQLPPELFTQPVPVSKTDGSGTVRPQMRKALDLLKEAGWELKGGKLLNAGGDPLRFTVMIDSPGMERVTQPWVQNLRRIGIDANIQSIPDSATYQRRMDKFDFDATVVNATFYPPPGPELVSRFKSSEALVDGTGNWSGIRSPVVDALLDEVLKAQGDLPRLTTAAKALDRVLMWGFYVVPQWYNSKIRVAYWNRFGHPEKLPTYGDGFPELWWQTSPQAKPAP
jgi:microcin C transport system substrate-binding protein